MSSYDRAQKELVFALQDPGLTVIALVGKWGSGKTHLWRQAWAELAADPRWEPSEPPALVSLFGVRELSDLSLQIAQQALVQDADRAGAGEPVAADQVRRSAATFSFIDLAAGARLALAALLRDRLVVIDDIERKHPGFGIDELLGFIDTARQRWRTRFLLILNTDRLADEQDAWRTLHEKVIERQIALSPSPAEALAVAMAGIAAADAATIAAAQVAPVVGRLGLTNIRMIRRVVQMLERVIGAAGLASPEFLARIAPSVVLMSAIHYRALTDAPTLDYVVGYTRLGSQAARASKSAQQLQWDALIERAGIDRPGEFERVLKHFLESGHLDAAAIRQVVADFDRERAVSALFGEAERLLVAARWDIHRQPGEVVEQARRFVASAAQLPAYLVGELAQAAGDNGGPEVERALIDACLARFDELVARREAGPSFFHSPDGQLHPRLRARATQFDRDSLPERTLTEALLRILDDRDWGEAEKRILARAAPEHFVAAMNAATPDELMRMVTGLLRWMKGLSPCPEADRAHATFLVAARTVTAQSPYSLLTRLLLREFALHGEQQRLRPGSALSP